MDILPLWQRFIDNNRSALHCELQHDWCAYHSGDLHIFIYKLKSKNDMEKNIQKLHLK